MLVITVEVDAPVDQAIGIKEDLAEYLERFGDIREISVDTYSPKQLTMWDKSRKEAENWTQT